MRLISMRKSYNYQDGISCFSIYYLVPQLQLIFLLELINHITQWHLLFLNKVSDLRLVNEENVTLPVYEPTIV